MGNPLTFNELEVLILNNKYVTQQNTSGGKISLPVILNPDFVKDLISEDIIARMPENYVSELVRQLNWSLSFIPDNNMVTGLDSITGLFDNLFKDEPDVAKFITNLLLVVASYQRNPEMVDTYRVTNYHQTIQEICLDSPYPIIDFRGRESAGLSEMEMGVFNTLKEQWSEDLTLEKYKEYWKSFYEMLVNGVPMPMKYDILNFENSLGMEKLQWQDYAGKLFSVTFRMEGRLGAEPSMISRITPRYATPAFFSKTEKNIDPMYSSRYNTDKFVSWLPLYVWTPIEGKKGEFMNWDFIPF
tara:strand:+ start:265 stop:1164 length:900 start_codon:yes stop_codon:yes gene_type:complete